VAVPLIVDGCFGYNGNWELSMVEAIMAISVFTEDKASFAVALKLWRGRVPGYFYLSKPAPAPHLRRNRDDSPETLFAVSLRFRRDSDTVCCSVRRTHAASP
jgi:hypothetical protein